MTTTILTPALSFLTALIVSAYAIPAIIKVAFIKKLYDKPGGRKTHRRYVPNLGGIAIFASFLLTFICWTDFSKSSRLQYFILGLLVLHFIGVKDDIVPLVPLKKMAGQVIAAAILVIPGRFRITDLYGVFGVHQLPVVVSIVFSIFVVLVIVNSFNLIDGIDGLAGGIALIVSLVFSYTFWSNGQLNMLVGTLALSGALVSFLFYNKSPARIFMGDAGSMGIGYLMAAFTFQFLHLNGQSSTALFHLNPTAVVAFLILPLFDTMRVFGLRLLQGKSPFSADRNHIHHRLLGLGLTHGKACMVLCAINASFIGLAWLMRKTDPNLFILIVFLLAGTLSGVPAIVGYLRKKKLQETIHATPPVNVSMDATIQFPKTANSPVPSEIPLN